MNSHSHVSAHQLKGHARLTAVLVLDSVIPDELLKLADHPFGLR